MSKQNPSLHHFLCCSMTSKTFQNIPLLKRSIQVCFWENIPNMPDPRASPGGIASRHGLCGASSGIQLLWYQILLLHFIQETSDHSDVVLATFETSALELLFPYPQLRGPYCAGVDVDLLMEPTRDFPGIIAPKVVSFVWFVQPSELML